MKALLVMITALCASGVFLVQNLAQDKRFAAPDVQQVKSHTQRTAGTRRHLVSRHRDGHFYLNTTVEGRPVVFLVDSGASHVMLTAEDARRLGRQMRKRDFKHEFHTANGVNRAAKIKLAQMRIGGKDFAKVEAYVFAEGLSVSLLGQTLLGRFAAVEMRRDQLELRW